MLSDVEKIALLSELKNGIIPELDDRYVRHDSCSEVQRSVYSDISAGEKRAAVTDNKVSGMEKALWILATSCVGQFVSNIFDMLMR